MSEKNPLGVIASVVDEGTIRGIHPRDIAKGVVSDLGAAGYVVLRADRWNRVRTALKCECEVCGEWCDVLPGDLDPIAVEAQS